MPPTLENNFASSQRGLPQYAQHEFASSSPGAPFYAASPVGSANNSSSKGRKPGVDALEGLRALPEVRPIPWQEGKELPPDKSTESQRSQTRGAFLLSTRGQIRDPPCSHCATGVGRFSACISLDGWFHGACATCQMGTRGNLCSLRKEAEAEGLIFKVTPSKLAEPHVTRSPPLPDSDYPTASLKRKRDSPSTMAAAAQSLMNSYDLTQMTLPPPSQTITSHNLPPNDMAGNNASALINYVYEKQYPPNGTKRHQILYRAQSNPQEAGRGPSPPPMHKYKAVGAGQNLKTEAAREGSNSLSPSTQLIQPAQPPPYETSYRNTSMTAQSEARDLSHPATPLIDTLPRKKQKQIYQIIGGVQSGIRSVRQQTESLQKQLNLLQAALGIDADEENEESLI